jgi:MerR family transcriptional regulator, light-induced transcriptional regulator
MSEVNEMSATILLHSARALAGYAASELFESRPELMESLGPDAFSRWHNLLTQCLEELAGALAANRPQLFVEHVRWMKAVLKARGVQAGALKSGLDCLNRVLVAELPTVSATAAAGACQEAVRSLDHEDEVSYSRPLTVESVYGRLAGSYLLALLEGDRSRATRLILNAAEAGHSVADLYLKVLLPAQEEAGRMWQEDEINVAEEHFATATTKMLMSQLRSYVSKRAPNGKTLLASAVAGNHHEIGIHAVAEFFEMDGWRVIQLGSDVPVRDLVEAVGFYQADLLGLSVCLRTQLATLKQTIEAVRRSERVAVVKILVGGRGLVGASDLAAEFGADGYAADPSQAVALGNTLVGLGGDGPPGADAPKGAANPEG